MLQNAHVFKNRSPNCPLKLKEPLVVVHTFIYTDLYVNINRVINLKKSFKIQNRSKISNNT